MKTIGLHRLGTLILMLTTLLFTGCGGGSGSGGGNIGTPPVLANGATFNIDESVNSGTTVGSLVINSAGSASVTSIGLSGAGSGFFTAHPDGTIAVADGAAFDYET